MKPYINSTFLYKRLNKCFFFSRTLSLSFGSFSKSHKIPIFLIWLLIWGNPALLVFSLPFIGINSTLTFCLSWSQIVRQFISETKSAYATNSSGTPPTFWRVILYWLLEGGDVTEGAEKQDDFVLLVSDWSNLHKKPNWHPCSTNREEIWCSIIQHTRKTITWVLVWTVSM